ncbi:cytochrome P450 [Polyplosphaeria fusca]|uniref:Cytochrome P450 n=1 Tax=Polyplosphaeria fusca TaxID=682080 RepID=A0A9P4QYC2_9PLEO|nr:cytochrome P450 [Polyplosphaeria fusca]
MERDGSSLHDAAHADALHTAGAAALLGTLFHLSVAIRDEEFERIMLPFIGLACAVFSGTVCAFAAFGQLGIVQALLKTVLVATGFNTGLFLSIGAYRLFFHRLRKFPGPFAAKLTKFHAVYRAAKTLQLHREREALHEQYGDVVRVGPREVSILRKSALPLIYGPMTDCRKSSWYGQAGHDTSRASLHMERDRKSHRMRRRAWDRAFSTKALLSYEARIATLADTLVKQIQKTNGQPVNSTEWAMFYSFDVMGALAFQDDFGQMKSGVENSSIKGIHDTMSLIGVLGNAPWSLVLAGCLPESTSGFANFFKVCAAQLKEKEKTFKPDEMPQDILSWLLKATNERDATAPPTRKALEDDVRFMIVAGSETSATSVAYELYFLAKHPEIQEKLRAELLKAVPGGVSNWTYDKVKEISYLDDFINETLRLKPPVPLGIQRETSEKGLRIDDDIYIPPRTTVMIPLQAIQKDPRYWPQAEEFIPERWGERKAEMGTDGAPFFAFGLGPHLCAGKHMAYMSMRIALSKLVMEFDVKFAPGEDGIAFYTQESETFSTLVPPLQLKFTPLK